jgi:tetratricopeptide (TPR) repeat protein
MGATLRPQCPGEGDLLAFYERDLSSWKRARIEKHLSECESCRESIAMMVSFGRASNENASDETSSVSQDVMGAQLSRIAAMAREDEGRQRLSERPGRSKPVLARWSGTAFALPLSNRVLLGTVALLFILLAVPVLFWIQFRPSATQQAMRELDVAVSPGRNSETVVSGLRYSPSLDLRGGQGHDDLMFERAFSKVAFAQDAGAPTEARHALARVWLARNAGNDAQSALAILNDIDKRQPGNPTIQNDLGVAEFELGQYGDAATRFSKALDLSPLFRGALFNRAVAEKANAQYAEAIRDFEEFIKTNPEDAWRSEAERNVRRLRSLLPSPD